MGAVGRGETGPLAVLEDMTHAGATRRRRYRTDGGEDGHGAKTGPSTGKARPFHTHQGGFTMDIEFGHHGDHATITWPEQLTPTAGTELVATVETMRSLYYYDTVELVIVSASGGHIGALRYLNDALARWRATGVHIRTRVVASAESAAALMLSLGDERIAEPGAILLYHPVRIPEVTQLTAHGCARLGVNLERIDELWIAQLVERALGNRGPREPHACGAGDETVLRKLLGAKVPRRRAKRPVDDLARELERRVDAAVAKGERDRLARLYRRLFEMDIHISAQVAYILRLVDRIGTVSATVPKAPGPVGLTIPEWKSLHPPEGAIPRAVLTRHTLMLGETGSGKTVSGVLPVVGAMARAPEGVMGCGLVIDPKRDLRAVLERLAPQRLRTVTTEDAVLDVMAGPRWCLAADLAAGRYRSVAVRILHRLATFSPANPAHVLEPHEVGSSNAEFFNREGCELLITVLVLIAVVTAPQASEPDEWLCHDREARRWVERLRGEAGGASGLRGPNVLALAAWVLGDAVMHRSQEVVVPLGGDDDEPPRRKEWLLARIADEALGMGGDIASETREVLGRVGTYWNRIAAIEPQWVGTLGVARGACAELAAPAIARSLYFGLEPGFRTACDAGERLDLATLVAPAAAPAIVLFQPAREGPDTLFAIALKALFFEAVLNDPARIPGGTDLPLVGYVADECQRFITSDPVHGEQSFLDTCRSFGGFCVLACQSVSSLTHALAGAGGDRAQNEAAIEVLWNNAASKLVFRTTDERTAQRMDALSPHRPGMAGVVRVRPPMTLAPGEAYAVLADGRFERRQLAPFAEPAPEQAQTTKKRKRRRRRRAKTRSATP